MDSAQAATFSASLIDRTIGGWLVTTGLGHGKSAVVMLATCGGVSGALKVFHPELIERYGEELQIERINRERTLIGVEHPNLVKIYDGGKCSETGNLFVVMEVIPYKNLHQVLADIPHSKVRTIVRQLAAAAYFLEQHRIVHRDIKPENIAISDDFEHVKLLDLGVILPIGLAGLTDVNSRTFIGTLRYSSPEFLERKEEQTIEGWRAVTFYQLGAVLHDLLMRKQIFSDQSEPYSVLVKAVFDTMPEVYGADTKLVRICNHSLIKNPATRFQLVTWDDFLNIEDDKNLAALTKRIGERQRYFLSNSAIADIPHGEHERLLNQKLVDLCHQIEVRLGIIFVDFPCFPLRRTETTVNSKIKSGHISIFFEKKPQIGLPYHLALHLLLTLVDENMGVPIYSLNGYASLSPSELEFSDTSVGEKISLGKADDIITGSNLSEFLLSSLDLAYLHIEENGDTVIDFIELKKE